jgi:hypothetical protein
LDLHPHQIWDHKIHQKTLRSLIKENFSEKLDNTGEDIQSLCVDQERFKKRKEQMIKPANLVLFVTL